MSTPSTPSPGPGWWMAADGQYYPQQWEYSSFRAWGREAQEALQLAKPMLEDSGRQGWEMINHSAVWVPPEGMVTYTYYFKRPIRPGS